jgi:hypothetical protein
MLYMQMVLTGQNVRTVQGMVSRPNKVWCQYSETILTKYMAFVSINPSKQKEQMKR